jgi:glutathione S-transferase
MTFTIYGPGYSTYVRTVRMVLEEKGAPYELVEVDLLKGEHRQPAHLARNPFGTVPAFEQNGFALYESRAIATYLDRILPEPRLTPSEPRAEARMLQIQGIVDSYAYDPMIRVIFIQRAVIGAQGGTVDEAAIAAARPKAELALAEVERLMGGGPFLAGAEPSLADLWLAPVLAYFRMVPEGRAAMAARPGLTAWLGRIEARPSFARTAPRFG